MTSTASPSLKASTLASPSLKASAIVYHMSSEDLLTQLYYDPSTGLIGAQKLYKRAKEMMPEITLKTVKEFVSKQKLSQVFSAGPRQKAKFQITGVIGHYQSDLTFYEQYKRQNSNYSIILTLIEVNTKRAFATALKDKNASSMREGLEKLINQLRNAGLRIRVIQSDNGTEYTNRVVKEYLKSEGIEQMFCQISVLRENDKRCLAVAERFNRTLKSLLNKYMENNLTSRWVDVLDSVLVNYNSSFHSSIKMRPVNVDELREQDIIAEKQSLNNTARQQLPRLQVKDSVRLPVKKRQFDKEGKTFSDDVFEVEKVNARTVRVVGDVKLYPIDKVLKVNQVQEYKRDKTVETVTPTQAKKHTVKEAKRLAKVKRIIRKEGVDESNIIKEPRVRKQTERLKY
jgi:hypothetical protein